MTPRTRNFAIVGTGLTVALAASILYGIGARDVHADAAPPAVLDKWKVTEARPEAPAIGFVDAAGKTVNLADFKGRYVLVNLWATWCGPCINELPELAQLQKELPQDRIVVVPVDVLERLDSAKLDEFLKMHGVDNLSFYIDKDRATQRGFVANELPLTVLIDAEGREVARAAGGQKWADPASIAYLKAVSAAK